MSISAIKHIRKTLLRSLAVTLFSGVFTLVYNSCGHGITSWYMDYLFLPPLIGGVLVPFLLSLLCKPQRIPGQAVHFWFAGVFTTEGYFLVRGILEIAMSSSPFLPVYLWAAGVMFLASGLSLLFGRGMRAQDCSG